MSKKLTKKNENIGEQIFHVILGSTLVIMIVLGAIKLTAPEMLTTYAPGQCYVKSKDKQVTVKITQIREDERDGTVIIYDFHDERDYPYTNGTNDRSKKDFKKIYKENIDCQVHDLKSELTGTRVSDNSVLEAVQHDRTWWREQALELEKRLHTCWKENSNVKAKPAK